MFGQIAQIVRLENEFYVRQPRLLAAAFAVALIPAIYVVIYLSSVWDPVAHTGALPVALANLDRDIRYRDQSFNLGAEVTANLKSKRTFGYTDVKDAEEARRLVREGRMAFALVIPADFSTNAVPGTTPGAGRIEVIASEGNSYQSAALARRFADEIGREINDRLNERRWKLVLESAAGSERGLEQLRGTVSRLRSGGDELVRGSAQAASGSRELHARQGELNEGVAKLAGGAQELGGAVRTLEARQPAAADLQRLKSGADELARSQADMGKGLTQLKSGSAQLRGSLTGFRDEAQGSLFVTQQVQEGAVQMADGMVRLDDGLQSALVAQQQLADGTGRLGGGVAALVDGTRAQGEALRKMVAALPPDNQLGALTSASGRLREGTAALADGSRRLQEGATALSAGLDLLARALPSSATGLEGSAEGLSHSVQPQVTVFAAVPNNGSAYAPNIIPAALWLGAGIAAFLVHVRVLPRQAQMLPRFAQLAGKVAMPGAIVLLQAMLVLMAVSFVLQLKVASLAAVALILALSALTFLMIVFALTRAFGDAGKALSILFLAIQLSSSGGVLPIELSGGVFADISPWLPLTWVVKALKAGMFGAFDDGWGFPLLAVGIACAIATAAATHFGSWRYVEQESMRPAVDI